MIILAQILGLLSAGCGILAAQMKKKWQILVVLTVANLLAGLNFLFLGQVNGAFVCGVGIAQTVLVCYQDVKGKASKPWEMALFTVLYIACGVVQYRTAMDLMPTGAALLGMCGVFQKKEQNIRKFSLMNALVWVAYDVLVGSSLVVTHAIGAVSNVAALYRFRGEK